MRTPLAAFAVLVAPLAVQAQTTDSTAVPVPVETPAPVPVEVPAPTQSIAQLVAADTSYSILATALQQTGLLASLESGEFTLLAPTNAAFRALPNYPAILEPANARALYSVLMAHVVPGTYLAVHLPQMATLRTWAGTDLALATTPAADAAMAAHTTVAGVDIARADVLATNGVLHAVEAVLPVPEAQ